MGFEPRIRELLKAYPSMPASVIAERIGWPVPLVCCGMGRRLLCGVSPLGDCPAWVRNCLMPHFLVPVSRRGLFSVIYRVGTGAGFLTIPGRAARFAVRRLCLAQLACPKWHVTCL
jgi:hypothetical protein